MKNWLKRNSSVILTCVSAAGVVATTVLAVKATPKAMELLEEAQDEADEELRTVDKVRIVAPEYLPALVTGSLTVACMFGAHIFDKKQQASLMSAYGLIDRGYKNYRGKVKELCGENVDTEVQDAMSRDRYKENPVQVTEGKLLWYEPYRDEFFELTEKEVIDAEYHMNRSFILRGETNLNEFYEFLGLDPTDAGCEIGWEMNANEYPFENTWIDFEHHLVVTDEGTEYYRIEIVPPSGVAVLEDY